ncbi:hypothetical protein P280DRAFT_319071 [Massarina eburnea CBS 473.64]|uniref:Uncharacterized protein n=1 Tax=Massarina eburnea CBS 473.64 TaxID=1395130 RepID=A0A6A6RGH6_9PLEO|nr:hypothetical protein P280DRAFT_319071 [Massarina eburnea CBS 473.64]
MGLEACDACAFRAGLLSIQASSQLLLLSFSVPAIASQDPDLSPHGGIKSSLDLSIAAHSCSPAGRPQVPQILTLMLHSYLDHLLHQSGCRLASRHPVGGHCMWCVNTLRIPHWARLASTGVSCLGRGRGDIEERHPTSLLTGSNLGSCLTSQPRPSCSLAAWSCPLLLIHGW